MQKIKLILMVSAVFVCFSCLAEIYKWKDKNGITQYSDVKPENTLVETFDIQSYESVTIVDEEQSDSNSLQQKQRKHLARSKKVIMYSTQRCGYCKKAKKYFKQNNIAYKNYDIDKSQSARLRYNKLGARGVPVIFVGKKRMNGFNIEQFNSIYTRIPI